MKEMLDTPQLVGHAQEPMRKFIAMAESWHKAFSALPNEVNGVPKAAFTDQPGGAQAGIVLPDPRTLELGWLSLFDTPGSVESTAPSANDIER